MREFALFRQYLEGVDMKTGKHPLKTLLNFPGSSSLWKSDKEDIVNDGELELVSEIKDLRKFKISLEYKRRKTQISEKSVLDTGSFEFWQHKGGLDIAIDSPRLLSNVAASFLSVVQFNELKAIKPLELNTKEFLALRNHAIKLDGRTTMLHLKNVESENIKLSVFQVHGNDLEKMDVEKMLKGAQKIKRVGFSIPNLMGESYSFWVADWGGGAIFKPTELLPHQITGILEFFEDALLLRKLDPK